MNNAERFDVVVVGGGQSGLAAGHYLVEMGLGFVILDAEERVGDAWRKRWDSLRLFTPAALSGLPGVPFAYPGGYFPTKDETADYLEAYAEKYGLPVRLGRSVDLVRRNDDDFVVCAGDEKYVAKSVVVAAGPYHTPRIPAFARDLDAGITQLHSSEYRNPGQLPEGDALVVGAGNSGAEISIELAATRRTYLSGRDTGNVPGGVCATHMSQSILLGWRIGWWLLSRLATVDTSFGKKGQEYMRSGGDPLVRFSPKDLERAAVERVPRVAGVREGKPRLADGRVMEVASVVWATGYEPDFGWIEAEYTLGKDGYPVQYRGAAKGVSGLYFMGIPFLHTPFSATVGGVGKDARRVAEQIARKG